MTVVPDEGQASKTNNYHRDDPETIFFQRHARNRQGTRCWYFRNSYYLSPVAPTYRARQPAADTQETMLSLTMGSSARFMSILAVCLVGGKACFAFQRTSLPPPHRSSASSTTHYSPSHPPTQTHTCLNLFDLREKGAANALANSKSYRSTSGLRVAYPKLEIAKLGAGNCPLPHVMDLQSTSNSRLPSGRLVVRYLEQSDLNQVVRMCVREFGSQAPSPDSASLPGQLVQSPRTPTDELKDWFEDWTLSLTVQIGLTQRIKRRKDASAKEPDHHVICLVEEGQDESGGAANAVVGIVELSQQVPDPEQTTPPFIVPYAIKKALGSVGVQNRAAVSTLGTEPLPYISNVLVRPESRGRGYSRILMAAAEGLARDWTRQRQLKGDNSRPPLICLHVDADSRSARAAQGLYKALGYKGVPDDRMGGTGGGGKFAWLEGADMLSTGLYMVQDIPLLYMTKELFLE